MTTNNDNSVTVTTKARDIPLKLTFGAIMDLEAFLGSSILTFGPEQIEAKDPDKFMMAVIYNAMTGRKVGDLKACTQGTIEMLRDVGMTKSFGAVKACLQQCLDDYAEMQEMFKNDPLLADLRAELHPTLKLVH